MSKDITLKEYQTIYRIVSSVGEYFSWGAGKSCQFYNVTAAYILSNVLKVKARPVMGAAFIYLNDNESGILSFATQDRLGIGSNENGFHCWLETDENFIDFTAPEYAEALNSSVPRKMFKKKKHSMVSSLDLLQQRGDFFFSENEILTNNLLRKMAANPAYQDFMDICSDWYRKYTKKKIITCGIRGDLGKEVQIKLKKCTLDSAW